jgi:uncharacterized protein (TIGR03435 family)
MRRAALLVALVSGVYAQSAKKLEFEAASVRPAPPPGSGGRTEFVGCHGGPRTSDPELFTCGGTDLGNLIVAAYGVEDYFRLSAPGWVKDGSSTFDVSARVPAGTTRDDFNVMLQNLLADRFKLAVHRESREMQRYALVVGKNGPKFKEASPLAAEKNDDAKRARAGTPAKLGDDGYPVLTSGMSMAMTPNGRARLHFPQMTMAMLAARLQTQLRAPVRDATGLKGEYDIGLYWDAAATSRLDASPPGGIQTAVASDPGPTLIEAVQDQLGLRLESKKGTVEFLIVDHAEKIPTEN